MHKIIIKCCRKDTNNFPILQTFLRLFAIIWLLPTPSYTPSFTCHMDFGKIIHKYQAKPLNLLLLCNSAMTPLLCRQRLYIQQMYSTLTVNRQNGQIHLFNLLLPNLPIDFIPVPMTLMRVYIIFFKYLMSSFTYGY